MAKEIIVGYDSSDSATEAALWAAQEASTRGLPLRIVSCFGVPLIADPTMGWTSQEALTSMLDTTQVALATIEQKVRAVAPEIEVSTEASPQNASFALIGSADADSLIVIGAGRHTGAAAFWLGSTARYIVRHSPCPVVVVRGAASRGRPDRIVVGVDGSPASYDALAWAGDEADRHAVNLLIVHAWLYPYLPIDTSSSQARDLVSVDAACIVNRAMEAAREHFSAEIRGQLVEGGAATSLLEAVRDGDLLVVGSRGRGAIASTLFGSTVNSLLDAAAVPVVVVRGTKETGLS